MTPKKSKEKQRRRARKLAEQAWEAADQDNLDLAEKIVRRAVATQPENPVLWNDQGLVLGLRGRDTDAADAFRTAARLAPTYAEPYAHLADLRARQGYLRDAVTLLEKAVRFAPEPATYAERLEAYRLQAGPVFEGTGPHAPQAAPPADDAAGTGPTAGIALRDGPRRLAAFDWPKLGERLTREGCVSLPALLDHATCEEIRNVFDDEALFAKTVVMDREDFGKGVYRYFRPPIPAVVDELRRAVYPYAARVANEWQQLLNEPERYPATWEEFREVCRAAGQTVPTPILLKYGPGGYNALHRDLRGAVFFPIQMAVILSPRAGPSQEGFGGGEFLLCDVPEGKKARRRVVPAGLGDAVLFCTRDRLVRVGGAYGLQPVNHGVAAITQGSRIVLGVPFHEYR
jgi:hypothetical protein